MIEVRNYDKAELAMLYFPKSTEKAALARLSRWIKRIPALFAATLSGCASDPVQLESDKTYRVEWIGERPLIDRSHLTITLGEDGRAYGSAGCNHWFASYRRDGDALRFEQPGATRKLCAPALMEQE